MDLSLGFWIIHFLQWKQTDKKRFQPIFITATYLYRMFNQDEFQIKPPHTKQHNPPIWSSATYISQLLNQNMSSTNVSVKNFPSKVSSANISPLADKDKLVFNKYCLSKQCWPPLFSNVKYLSWLPNPTWLLLKHPQTNNHWYIRCSSSTNLS